MAEVDIGYPHAQAKRVVAPGWRGIKNRMTAWGLDREYYDGARENGYGGFGYDGRWKGIIPGLARRYNLGPGSRVLDLGCKKGFFLHDLLEMMPGVEAAGVENHSYPLEHGMASARPFMRLAPYEELPFPDGHFDFVLGFASIYMLNLGGVMKALKEIGRVGKGQSFVTLAAYDTPADRALFEMWTLIGTTILTRQEWLEVFAAVGYAGDWAFTTAGSLGLVAGPAA